MKRSRIRSVLAQLRSRPTRQDEPPPAAQSSPAVERAGYWRRRAEETCFPELRDAYRRVADSYLGGNAD